MYDFAVVGAGIIGLATALELRRTYPDARLIVLEKEGTAASHQSGHNSGVVHSGIYYRPGSLKAKLCRSGNRTIIDFCREHSLKHEVCGKLIVATDERELPRLDALVERGRRNGLDVARLTPAEVVDIEPHVRCVAAIQVADTGIVDFRQISRKYAELHVEAGGELRFNTEVNSFSDRGSSVVVGTTSGEVATRFAINCAGLHSDRLARLAGLGVPARIVPFRGEYYELAPARAELVKGLVYPVPNPTFPFLGVHFTRMVNGGVHAGPNAVLSLKREGYRWRDFNLRDAAETLTFPGFWRLARDNYREGVHEVVRSLRKRVMVQDLQKLVPDLQSEDLLPASAGVRAQALAPSGKLVDDFMILRGSNSLHVCNAPSPAATASLEIAGAIVGQLPPFERLRVRDDVRPRDGRR
jgi:L-2-hydroxyglutarate oxidase